MVNAWSLSSGEGEPSWEKSPGTWTQHSNLTWVGSRGPPAMVPDAKPENSITNLKCEAVNLPGRLWEGVEHDVCFFPRARVKNYHKFCGLKQQKFILVQFGIPEV